LEANGFNQPPHNKKIYNFQGRGLSEHRIGCPYCGKIIDCTDGNNYKEVIDHVKNNDNHEKKLCNLGICLQNDCKNKYQIVKNVYKEQKTCLNCKSLRKFDSENKQPEKPPFGGEKLTLYKIGCPYCNEIIDCTGKDTYEIVVNHVLEQKNHGGINCERKLSDVGLVLISVAIRNMR
jgi:hypothetical protein